MKIDEKKQRKLKRIERDRQKSMEEGPMESNISKTLGDRFTRTLIILLLATLFVLPLLDPDTWISPSTSSEIGMQHLYTLY